MNNEAAKIFYYGMVFSILNYGLLIWGGALVATKCFKKLIRLHEKIVFNLFSNPGENRRNNIRNFFQRNDILKLTEVYKFNAVVSMYKTLYSNYNPFVLESLG